jgi:hypothetical protein
MSKQLMSPVPQGLREMLRDYPEHIQILQEDLNKVVAKRSPGIDPFDRAIWMLESTLGVFIQEAREELKAAEDSGDKQAISKANGKFQLMFDCRPTVVWKLKGLMEYFDTVKSGVSHGG